MKKLSSDVGLVSVYCASAGLSAAVGAQTSATALDVLKEEYGIVDFAHTAVQVTPELLEDFDLVIAMTRDHAQYLWQINPKKVPVLAMPIDVEDPFGGDYNAYKKCAARIASGLHSLVESGVIHD